MRTIGYQTLEDRDNIDEIETEGPFSCNRSDAWLGSGIYLWDYDMKWAEEWGKNAYERKGKRYVIGRCEIQLGESCFDLVGNMKHLADLREVLEVLKQSSHFAGKTLIVANVIEYLKRNKLFNYKSIRASEAPAYTLKVPYRINRGEALVANPRVQICVIEAKGVILPPFKVIYP